MNMKKKLIITALAIGIGLAGFQQVSARGWGGGNGGGCSCMGYGSGYQMFDDTTKAKVDAFRTDTMDLRRQIAMKRGEKMALMNSQSPDAAAVAKISGEIFDLRNTMAQKAMTAGVPMMAGQGKMRGFGNSGGRMSRPCYFQQ